MLSRRLPDDFVMQCLCVMRMGRMLDLIDKRAIAASQLAAKHKSVMADAVMYAIAQEFAATF